MPELDRRERVVIADAVPTGRVVTGVMLLVAGIVLGLIIALTSGLFRFRAADGSASVGAHLLHLLALGLLIAGAITLVKALSRRELLAFDRTGVHLLDPAPGTSVPWQKVDSVYVGPGVDMVTGASLERAWVVVGYDRRALATVPVVQNQQLVEQHLRGIDALAAGRATVRGAR